MEKLRQIIFASISPGFKRIHSNKGRRYSHSSSFPNPSSSLKFAATIFAGGAGVVGLPFLVNNHFVEDKKTPLVVNRAACQSSPYNGALPPTPTPTSTTDLGSKVAKADRAVRRYMATYGIPGLSIAVSLDGQVVWKRGFGLANVETSTPCTADTVMRVASISKAITSVLAGRLVEEGRLDLDKPIQTYLPDFPKKSFQGREVEITPRQLLSHTAGIRHYTKVKNEADPAIAPLPRVLSAHKSDSICPEFYSNQRYSSVGEALAQFRDDDLVAEPGTNTFNYTTHGYTLLAAVLEAAAASRAEANKERKVAQTSNNSKEEQKEELSLSGGGAKEGGVTFEKMLNSLFQQLGMKNTRVDSKERIVGNRASYYYRAAKTGRLENVPEVDNSNKIAGGGLISCVGDLLLLGNALLYSYLQPITNMVASDSARINNGQFNTSEKQSPAVATSSKSPLLRKSTIDKLWTPHARMLDPETGEEPAPHMRYCLGWDRVEGAAASGLPARKLAPYWSHSGGAVGACSVLVVKPESRLCLAIIHNCEAYGPGGLADELIEIFEGDN